MLPIAVRYGGVVHSVPSTSTPGAALEALLGAPPLLLLIHASSQDDPGAYALARLPGLAPLLPGDAKTRYLRLLPSSECLGAALARLPFPPAAIYALPVTAELLLLGARAQLSWAGSSSSSSGMGMGGALAAHAGGGGGGGAPLFTHDALLRLATLENEARLSPDFQALFAAAERDEFTQYQQGTWMELCSELQHVLVWLALGHRAAAGGAGDPHLAGLAAPPPLLAEGVLHAINARPSARMAAAFAAALAAGACLQQAMRGVHALRTAGNAFPGTIGRVSLYWRFNRVSAGRLRAGDAAPNAPLVALQGAAPTSLHALIAAHHPTPLLVLAGSYS